jgi:hypothetical protein
LPLSRHIAPTKTTKTHAARLCRPECFRHILKPPCRPVPCGESLPVQFVRDPPRGVTRRLQFPDAGQDALLRRVRFQVQAVRRHAVSEGDHPHPLTVRPLVVHSVPRPFPDGFPLPLG